MARQTRRDAAYTLLELLAMICIIAVVGAIGVPKYANALADYRASAAAQRIAGDLNLARTQAKTSSAGQSVAFDLTNNNYTLTGMTAMAGEGSTYSISLAKEPYRATLQTASFNSTTTLTYDRYGQPSAGGSVTVASGGYTKTILVDSTTGEATVQ